MTNESLPHQDARHLTLTTLEELWTTGVPIAIPVKGNPYCELRLDPAVGRLTLVTPYETPEPDVAKFRHIDFTASVSGDEELAELSVRVEGGVHNAYGLLASIADGVQIDGLPLAVAVAAGLAHHRNMLASRGTLNVEQEVGLFGELVFVEYLLNRMGASATVAAWQGPLSEEHDFVFDDFHVEVKTTSTERRRHTIHGLGQLLPLHDVPLFLLSLQLTRTTAHHGRTLAELVAQVRTAAGGHQVLVDGLLEPLGWHSEDADLYPTFWTLRSNPAAYAVNDAFPAITHGLLAPVVPRFELVTDVSYRIDVSDLEQRVPGEPLTGFLEEED